MSAQKNVCERCNTAYTRGAKFCPKCGAPVTQSSPGGTATLEKASEVIDKVSSTASKIQSTINSAGSIAKTARDLSTITIRPPAEWKVVVGEMLPVAGQKVIDKAISSAEQKVTGEVTRVVTEHLGKAGTQRMESFTPQQAAPSATTGVPCPQCGKPVIPGKKFCGSCGTKIEGSAKSSPAPSPVCPSCGNAIVPGSKFCGSCGALIGGSTKPASSPPSPPVCPQCGKPVIPGKKFCGSCGHPLR